MSGNGELTWAELISQPEAWAALIGRLKSGDVALPVDPGEYDEILLLGSGSSYYLALAVADWMRRRGFSARGVASCEVLLDPYETRRIDRRRLAIGISRSGRSSELLLAVEKLRDAGFDIMGISCSEGSEQLVQADFPLLIGEGHEDGLVMLRSFTSMLIALQWLTGSGVDRAALEKLPDAGRAAIDGREADIRDFAHVRKFDRFVFLGSGPDYPLALEAGLKIQEMAIATSEAYHSLDYRHGPKACADKGTLVLLFALSDQKHGLSLARDVKALGAALMVVGPDASAYDKVADLCIGLPDGMGQDGGSPAALVPAQMFAFATALRLGHNPDAPANLSKVVTF